jgi:hypothetical protein
MSAIGLTADKYGRRPSPASRAVILTPLLSPHQQCGLVHDRTPDQFQPSVQKHQPWPETMASFHQADNRFFHRHCSVLGGFLDLFKAKQEDLKRGRMTPSFRFPPFAMG